MLRPFLYAAWLIGIGSSILPEPHLMRQKTSLFLISSISVILAVATFSARILVAQTCFAVLCSFIYAT